MKSEAGHIGTHLIAWSQTEIDGRAEAPEDALAKGAYWRWNGASVELDKAIDLAPPAAFPSDADYRQQAIAAARNVVRRALSLGDNASAELNRDGGRAFTLSDGRESWVATMIHVPGAAHPLIVLAGEIPPKGMPLRIEWVETRPAALLLEKTAAVVCFTPGTWIETPGGARQIEHLAAGDKVVTLDGGVQELLWIGTRLVGRVDLARTPDLAPVRIREGALGQIRCDGDLVVSPDHLMLIRGHDASETGSTEVLVAARDLVNGTSILRDRPAGPVTYLHLLLESHHVLLANGFDTESFHPAAASLDSMPSAERLRLFDVMPELEVRASVYGPTARPVLSRAEASLIAA